MSVLFANRYRRIKCFVLELSLIVRRGRCARVFTARCPTDAG